MRLNIQASLIALGLLSTACHDAGPVSPSSSANPSSGSLSGVVDVRVQGRVVSYDTGAAAANVTVTTVPASLPVASAVTNSNGDFTLTVQRSTDWEAISLTASGSGFDRASGRALPTTANAVTLRAYQTPSISAGQSIQVEIAGIYACTFESAPCRRVLVAAGAALTLEAVHASGSAKVGLWVGAESTHPLTFTEYPSRVPVSGGDEVWVYATELGRVTLTATPR